MEGYNTKEENGTIRDPACITALRVSLHIYCIELRNYGVRKWKEFLTSLECINDVQHFQITKLEFSVKNFSNLI